VTSSHLSHRAVAARIRQDAELSQSFVIMNAIAAVIACYGLLINAAAVVIGGMVIAMLLGPITGIALGLVEGDGQLLRRSVVTEGVGVLIVLVIAYVIGLVHADLPAGSEIVSRTTPTIMDEIIALAGGVAVAYALTTPRVAASIAGVAIATALVPPLAVCGIMLARGQAAPARGALLLYVANFVAMQFAATVVLWLRGYHRHARSHALSLQGRIIGNAVTLGVLVALTAALGVSSYRSIRREALNSQVRTVVAEEVGKLPNVQLVDLTFGVDHNPLALGITVRTPTMPTYTTVVDLQEAIAARLQMPTALNVSVVLTRELSPLVPPTPTPTVTPSTTPTPRPSATATPTPTSTTTATGTVTSTAGSALPASAVAATATAPAAGRLPTVATATSPPRAPSQLPR
jgi:uncharacterized hydrophobic protein (TIGR00271 family)